MAKKKNNKVTSDDSVSADDQVTDISEVEVKKLISKGKEKGYITYDELNSVLSPEKFSSEKIEDMAVDIHVLEEALEHQFFFTPSNSIATFAYSDTDSEGNPIGIKFTLTTSDGGTGNINITLIHEPEKTEPGVSSGDITNAGGEADIEATFSVTVQ